METTVTAPPTPVQTDSDNPGLTELFDRCPPFAVYYGCNLLGGEYQTVEKLSKRSGLGLRTFLRTAYRTSWKGVKIGVMDKFCRACGVDIFHPENVLQALRVEIEKPEPFLSVVPQRREALKAQFNLLCAMAAVNAA